MNTRIAEQLARHFALLSVPIPSGWDQERLEERIKSIEALREQIGVGKHSFADVVGVATAGPQMLTVIGSPGRAACFITLHVAMSQLITECIEKCTPSQELRMADLDTPGNPIKVEHVDRTMLESLRGHAQLYGWEFVIPGDLDEANDSFRGFSERATIHPPN